jgi:hypothetical protein
MCDHRIPRTRQLQPAARRDAFQLDSEIDLFAASFRKSAGVLPVLAVMLFRYD